jgi:hypothetical protein
VRRVRRHVIAMRFRFCLIRRGHWTNRGCGSSPARQALEVVYDSTTPNGKAQSAENLAWIRGLPRMEPRTALERGMAPKLPIAIVRGPNAFLGTQRRMGFFGTGLGSWYRLTCGIRPRRGVNSVRFR